MKRLVLGVAVMTVGLMVSSCAMVSAPYAPSGFLYTSVQGPVAPGTSAADTMTGEACASSILGWIATGDASIDAAKRNGNIRSIASVDYEAFSVLGFYAKVCTIVKGASGPAEGGGGRPAGRPQRPRSELDL